MIIIKIPTMCVFSIQSLSPQSFFSRIWPPPPPSPQQSYNHFMILCANKYSRTKSLAKISTPQKMMFRYHVFYHWSNENKCTLITVSTFCVLLFSFNDQLDVLLRTYVERGNLGPNVLCDAWAEIGFERTHIAYILLRNLCSTFFWKRDSEVILERETT